VTVCAPSAVNDRVGPNPSLGMVHPSCLSVAQYHRTVEAASSVMTRLKLGAACHYVPVMFHAPSASGRKVGVSLCSWHTIGLGTDVVPWVLSVTSASNVTR